MKLTRQQEEVFYHFMGTAEMVDHLNMMSHRHRLVCEDMRMARLLRHNNNETKPRFVRVGTVAEFVRGFLGCLRSIEMESGCSLDRKLSEVNVIGTLRESSDHAGTIRWSCSDQAKPAAVELKLVTSTINEYCHSFEEI